MKKIAVILIAVLLIWNLYLTGEINNLKNKSSDGSDATVVNNNVSGFSTDLTKIVPNIKESIVGVKTESGYSSGVVVRTDDGVSYIATNYHAIENASYIEVVFDNLDKIKGELAGYDTVMDVALIMVETPYELKAISMGDSSLLKQGEFVLAIGNPISADYHGSLSFGIVSSASRIVETRVNSLKYYVNMIQSDVTLNSGNSGGALVNMAGELVGLNTMVLEIDDAEGMSFSIPVNELKLIIDEIIENGSVSKMNLGLKVTPISEMPNYLKSSLGISLDITDGLYVSEIKNDFFGYHLGIRNGDIITDINGVSMNSLDSYIKMEYQLEDRISVSLIRNGENVSYEREIVAND